MSDKPTEYVDLEEALDRFLSETPDASIVVVRITGREGKFTSEVVHNEIDRQGMLMVIGALLKGIHPTALCNCPTCRGIVAANRAVEMALGAKASDPTRH